MTTTDDAPSAARATTDSAPTRSPHPLRPYVAAAAWTLVGILYFVWLLDNTRTGDWVPSPQVNTAILSVLLVGTTITWPRRAVQEVARLSGEVHAMALRVDELEVYLTGLPPSIGEAAEDVYAAGYVDGVGARVAKARKLRLVAPINGSRHQ